MAGDGALAKIFYAAGLKIIAETGNKASAGGTVDRILAEIGASSAATHAAFATALGEDGSMRGVVAGARAAVGVAADPVNRAVLNAASAAAPALDMEAEVRGFCVPTSYAGPGNDNFSGQWFSINCRGKARTHVCARAALCIC